MSAASANDDDESVTMCCASCGIAEIDEIELKECDDCDLVRYCSDECQQEHKSEHEEACQKRMAELRDEILFKQPEISHHGDCPICYLPLPLDAKKCTLYSCCSKMICNGCRYAHQEFEGELQHKKCAFCRQPAPTSDKEAFLLMKKRMKANDPDAMCSVALYHKDNDNKKSYKYWIKAAGLGNIAAHFYLSFMYRLGKGVEENDKKALYHLEEAAIGGHAEARHIMGAYEEDKGRHDRAAKHWIIAANLGHDGSLNKLKVMYREGSVKKEDFASALRAHHDAVNATKSPQRERAGKKQAELECHGLQLSRSRKFRDIGHN